MKQQSLTTSESEKVKQSTPTLSDQDDEEEEGQATSLPGSTVKLDIVSWPSDETEPSGQVHVTVLPSGQVCALLEKKNRQLRKASNYKN